MILSLSNFFTTLSRETFSDFAEHDIREILVDENLDTADHLRLW